MKLMMYNTPMKQRRTTMPQGIGGNGNVNLIFLIGGKKHESM